MKHRAIQSKTILNKKKKRDPWFLDDYTLNPYSGCSFNCLYCYIRGSKYGEHMEEKLAWKENAIELLEKQLALRARKNQYGFIVISSSTDPYLQWESELQITRQLLQVILRFRFPVHIITKSDLVVRDFDLLHEINERAILPADLQPLLPHKALVTFSFSTLDPQISAIFEPGAILPAPRLSALKASLANGFHTGVSMMPLLPLISDTQEQLDHLYSTFYANKVKYAFPASLTLFGNGAYDSYTLTLRAIRRHFPEKEQQFLELFKNQDQPNNGYQRELATRIQLAQKKYPIPNSIYSLNSLSIA